MFKSVEITIPGDKNMPLAFILTRFIKTHIHEPAIYMKEIGIARIILKKLNKPPQPNKTEGGNHAS